ncbi:MAG: xanthine dehydrogenase molybdopterin binding subunit, partial [Caballeronia sp.]
MNKRTDPQFDSASDTEITALTGEKLDALSATKPERAAIGVGLPHESANLHVSGEATYVDDMPELRGTLHAALGLSRYAHARILSINLDAILQAPGVIAVLSADDIPGENNCGPVLHDDPILASGEVHYLGQPVFAVIAETHDLARRAAALAKSDDVIRYEPLEAILTPREAKAKQQFVLPPLHLKRGDPDGKMASAPHLLKGEFDVGGQEQFYL